MIELKNKEIVLENYGVTVRNYLTYAEIQNILLQSMKYQTWSERQQIIDYLLLCYVTDIPQNEIDTIGHDLLLQSGLIDEVKKNVCNYNQIQEGLTYEESLLKMLNSLSSNLPVIVDEALEKAKENGIYK